MSETIPCLSPAEYLAIARQHGAKINCADDGLWQVLDQPGTVLWHAWFKDEATAAVAYCLQHGLPERIDPKTRPLWRRVAETREGNQTLIDARHLSTKPENMHLTDGQLIRLAHYGATGDRA